jgi:ribonuclease BN (tRNA processing enzyme)
MSLSVTVLGSGGPFTNPSRVSSGYLISLDGRPRILVDAGGGIYQRLGRAALDLGALEAILLTHTHIDHTGGLAPVVFDLYMRDRNRPIAFVGPAGQNDQPGCSRFIDLLFGDGGAWNYLHTFDGFGYDTYEVPSALPAAAPSLVPLRSAALADIGLSVRSVAVPHGMMPATAYRIDVGPRSVTLSGDVSEASAGLIALAKNTDVLIHDMALPERDVPNGNLHAKPSAVGRVARESGARTLIATHFMPLIEPEIDDALAIVRAQYPGPVFAARDLAAYEIDETGAHPQAPPDER